MRDVCRGCRSCRGRHTDVQCCGKTVHQTRFFSHTFSVTRPSCYSSWRTWACFRIRCSAIPAVEIWHGPHNLIFLKDLFRWWCWRKVAGAKYSESRSIKHGSWFQQSNLTLQEILFITYDIGIPYVRYAHTTVVCYVISFTSHYLPLASWK